MQFYFIRHGQSSNNALYLETGDDLERTEDPELTEIGWQQANRVGQFLARDNPDLLSNGRDPKNLSGFHLTHLYCSLMLRAVQTGSAIADAVDLPLHSWMDLHEAGGIFLEDRVTGEIHSKTGKGRSYFSERFPRLVLPEDLDDTGWWKGGFEAHDLRLPRAARFLHDLLKTHGGTEDRVAVVSHGAFYNYLMLNVLGLPKNGQLWFSIQNTAMTRIDFQNDQVTILYTNRTEHLPPELITD